VAEEVEAVEGAEEVVAKAENKRRLGQKGENTKLEVKKIKASENPHKFQDFKKRI